jgi:peptidoglycan/LPS O-acetylase OafA/YrhL
MYPDLAPDGHSVAWHYLAALLFMNQFWYAQIAPGSDIPYWSLGYEVWYYVLFGIAFFAPGRWKLAGIAVIAVIVGPKIMAMFPLWLLGAGCYHLTKRSKVRPMIGGTMFFGSLALWLAYEVWIVRYGWPLDIDPAFIDQAGLIQAYLVGALFAVNLVGFAAWGRSGFLKRQDRVIRWLAGATFSVYLFHYPIMHFLAAELSWPPAAWRTRFVIIFGTLVSTFVLAELSERRKTLWRSAITRLFCQPMPGVVRVTR